MSIRQPRMSCLEQCESTSAAIPGFNAIEIGQILDLVIKHKYYPLVCVYAGRKLHASHTFLLCRLFRNLGNSKHCSLAVCTKSVNFWLMRLRSYLLDIDKQVSSFWHELRASCASALEGSLTEALCS